MASDFKILQRRLLKAIQQFLISQFLPNVSANEVEKTVVLFTVEGKEIVYKMNSGIDSQSCERIDHSFSMDINSSDLYTIDIRHYPFHFQSHILNLLTSIEKEKSGYILWDSIDELVKKMPSSLRLFNNLRPLVLSLKAILNSYHKNEFKASDEYSVTKRLLELQEYIATLIAKLNTQIKKYKELKKEVLGLRKKLNDTSSYLHSQKVANASLKQAIAEKELIINSLYVIESDKDRYKEQNHKLLEQNQLLLAKLSERTVTLDSLIKEVALYIEMNQQQNQSTSTRHSNRESTSSLTDEEAIQYMRRLNLEHERRIAARRSNRAPITLWQEKNKVSTEAQSDIYASTRNLSSSNG